MLMELGCKKHSQREKATRKTETRSAAGKEEPTKLPGRGLDQSDLERILSSLLSCLQAVLKTHSDAKTRVLICELNGVSSLSEAAAAGTAAAAEQRDPEQG